MDRKAIRSDVWSRLIEVAKPDSRFHLDFNEYIPDFEGSDAATARLCALPEYQSSQVVFITPDNCLEAIRAQALRDSKDEFVTTYGIRRGFIELLPAYVPDGHEEFAVLLDSLERFGRPISLASLRERYQFDLLITGASAVSLSGVRFGKGHGFFDLEWAMLTDLGIVDAATPIIALVHDCQVLDIPLEPDVHDVVCDIIVTPTRVIRVQNPVKSTSGVLWERVTRETLESIPVLRELQSLNAASI